MKLLIILLLTISSHTLEAKSLYRLSSNRFVHFPVGLSRCRLQISPTKSDFERYGYSHNGNLASIALNNCPGTTGKCLKAVRMAVQKSKGMPLVGECLSAKNFGKVLVEKYQASRLPISDPEKAEIGSIIIYAPKGGRGHGHIEIVTHKGYVSDHLSKKFYAGKVLGIYAL